MLDEQRLRRILEVGQAIVSELDSEALLRRVLAEAQALTRARYGALGILDERRAELERFLTLGIEPDVHAEIGDLPRGRGVLGVLIHDPQPLRLDDVSQHPRSYGFPVGHPRMRTFLGVPIVIRGEAFGNLYLTDKEGGEPFDADDEEAIVLLAGWASVAIDNARAYRMEHDRREELEQAVRALEATTAIARAVGGETDLDRVLELIVKRARALVDARGVVILLQRGDSLSVEAVAGRLGDGVRDVEVPIEGSVSGEVMRTRKVQRIADVESQLRYALAERVEATTGLFVPLTFHNRSLGVLCAFDRGDGGEFRREDERLLESFAASAATAVATAQSVADEGKRRAIEASERERQRWARELHDETLQELAGLKVLLAAARRVSGDKAAVEQALGEGIAQIDTEITGLRRLITDLRPATLDSFGVKSALEGLAERVSATTGLEVELEIDLGYESGRERQRHTAAVEDTIYRLVQESLTNVVKHAEATRVTVAVREIGEVVEIDVRDDGAGFDPDTSTEGFGLLGMRERAALAGGSVAVESSPGHGSTIHAIVPQQRRGGVRTRAGDVPG
jgi:signal transduction histidine kinase